MIISEDEKKKVLNVALQETYLNIVKAIYDIFTTRIIPKKE